MQFCDRCHLPVNMVKGSMFNTEMICSVCLQEEQAHPKYRRAREIEIEHVRAGDNNYKGIGLPSDLRQKAKQRQEWIKQINACHKNYIIVKGPDVKAHLGRELAELRERLGYHGSLPIPKYVKK